MRRWLTLVVLILLAFAVAALGAEAPAAPADAWVYEDEPFKVAFDHDGAGVGRFLIEIDGATLAEAGPEALLQRTVTVAVRAGLPLGRHTVDVWTIDEAGVVTAKAKTLRLDVRARRADRAADNLRIVRGTIQER
jgi:hypothetical protein